MKEIIVASLSTHKIKATEAAARHVFVDEKFEIRGVAAKSGINELPYGLEETKLGAENRLTDALKANGDDPYDIAVTIESGIFPQGSDENRKYNDHAVVIVQSADGKREIEISAGVEFPKDVVEQLLAEPDGFVHTTVGSRLHERNPEISATDPHTYLTNGERSREELLTDTIATALIRLLTSSEAEKELT